MQILNTYVETSLSIYVIFLFVMFVIGFILASLGAYLKKNGIALFATILLLCNCCYGYISFTILNIPVETQSKTRYECLITDVKTFDNYTIIEHRGDIWVLEEQENADTRTNS